MSTRRVSWLNCANSQVRYKRLDRAVTWSDQTTRGWKEWGTRRRNILRDGTTADPRRTNVLLGMTSQKRGSVRHPSASLRAGLSTEAVPFQTWLYPASPLQMAYSTLMARAARTTSTDKEIRDCSMAIILAHPSSTAVSVGEKAVLVLKARNR